jgi:hypothetical protein
MSVGVAQFDQFQTLLEVPSTNDHLAQTISLYLGDFPRDNLTISTDTATEAAAE